MALDWDADCDFVGDQAHHERVCAGGESDAVAHRAVRHHNWLQSTSAVQSWTQAPQAQAKADCIKNAWTQLPAAPRSARMDLVTYVALGHLRDNDLKERILRDRNDAGLLKQAAQAWHRQFVAAKPEHALWFGARKEVDAVSASANAKPVHSVVAALGLWHFGQLVAGRDGAILRVVYRVIDEVHLYKPDWRHGFPHFYFASACAHPEAGRTRNLSTGQLHCKEWVAKLGSLDEQQHLTEAQCVMPVANHCHYDLTDLYWQNLASEIRQYATGIRNKP